MIFMEAFLAGSNATEAPCWQLEGFGPAAATSSCAANGRDDFDFTLLFEQSVLNIGPSVLLLLAIPLRWFQLLSQSRKTKGGDIWGRGKLASIIVFGVLQLVLLILWTRLKKASGAAGKVSITASALGFLDAIALCILSVQEHRKSLRPSTLISIYLLFSIAFDAVQCRTLWLLSSENGLHTIAAVLSASIAIKITMLLLEARQKRKALAPAWKSLPPEALSGVISHSLFWWLNDFMLNGFKNSLKLETLWPTDQSMGSERLMVGLSEIWGANGARTGKHALMKAMMGSLKGPFMIATFPRLCLIGFKFSQPLLIQRVVDFVGELEKEESRNIGYGLIGATALIYIGLAISNGVYNYKNARFITMARGSLVSMVFSKTLTVSAQVNASKGSNTLTLMSTDVERISRGLQSLHEVWASPIEVGIAVWLLERQMGAACIVPVIIALASTVAIIRLTKLIGPAQVAWNKGGQERVSLTSSILGSMKEVKLLGLSNRWSEDIQALRIRELELSKRSRTLSSKRIALMQAGQYLTPVITFGAFLAIARNKGEPLSVATAFTSLSVMSLLSAPLSAMFQALPQFSMTLACFGRIEKFLREDDRPDPDTSMLSDNARPSTSQAGVELENFNHPFVSVDTGNTIIKLENAAFGVKESGLPVIRNLNLHIRRSTLTMIIGKVGSGKSALLAALIGELPLTSGTIQRQFSEAGYCEQQAWLVNDTIQNNILGQSTLEARWYDSVVKACALDKDFEELEAGVLSLVGSKGISLSGGQKARVALARAIYSRQEVVVIDDVLSGLDWKTQEFVWDNVFGRKGIFRQHTTTVILSTHAVRHLREADNILVLGEDGSMLEQGSFGALDLQSGYVQSLLLEGKQKAESTEDDSTQKRDAIKRPANTAAPEATDEQRGLTRRTGDVQIYKYYFKSIGWKHVTALFVLTVAAEFCAYFPQLWIKWWAEADTKNPGDKTATYYGVYVMLGVVGLLFATASVLCAYVIITPRSGRYLHLKLLNIIMGAPLSFFVATDTGITVNRFSQDMSLVDMALPVDAFMTLISMINSIAGMLLIVSSLAYMAAFIPLAIVFLYGLQLFYLRTSRQLRYLDLEAKSPLYTHLLETVQGLSTIRAFGWSGTTLANSLNLLDMSQRPHYLLYCVQRWLNLVLDLFVAGLAVVFVGLAVSLKSVTVAGAVGVALLNLLKLNSSLALVITSWTELETSLGAIARLKDLENETPKEEGVGEDIVPQVGWPEGGRVTFEHVQASYTYNSEPVLHDVSFAIEAGQKVAICGRTGSGKSSLLLTLFRLLDLSAGCITIDGLSTATIPRSYLRSHLNIITQDPVIFPGSVRLNAAPTPAVELSDDSIIAALTLVQLWPMISSRGGLSADMSTIPLSQGQKQLFCLARAILLKDRSPILVLDEATSNVDRHTDELMQNNIREEWRGKTIIAVVHKLDTVMGFDRIVMLDKGRVMEFDAPEVLLGRKREYLGVCGRVRNDESFPFFPFEIVEILVLFFS